MGGPPSINCRHDVLKFVLNEVLRVKYGLT